MGILDFLTGGGLGAIAGAASGIAGKVIELKMKDKELDQRKLDHAHELALRDKDREMAKQESETKLELHKVDADAAATLADLSALQASFGADKAAYGDHRLGRIADFIRGVTRPIVTYGATALVGYTSIRALALMDIAKLPPVVLADIVSQGNFIAAMAISWWFAARPGKLVDFTKRK